MQNELRRPICPDEAARVWRLLASTHARLLRQIDRELNANGLVPLEWFEVLAALDSSPGKRLRLGDLAETAGLSCSGLTRLVDRLEAAGLAERATDSADRRVTWAVLTIAGQQALAAALPAYRESISRALAGNLDPEDLGALRHILGKLHETVKPARIPCPEAPQNK